MIKIVKRIITKIIKIFKPVEIQCPLEEIPTDLSNIIQDYKHEMELAELKASLAFQTDRGLEVYFKDDFVGYITPIQAKNQPERHYVIVRGTNPGMKIVNSKETLLEHLHKSLKIPDYCSFTAKYRREFSTGDYLYDFKYRWISRIDIVPGGELEFPKFGPPVLKNATPERIRDYPMPEDYYDQFIDPDARLWITA